MIIVFKLLWIKTNHSRASVQPPHMEEASHLSSLDKAPLVPCRCSSYKASTDERWTNVQESNFRSQKSLSGVIFVNFWGWEGPLYGVRGPVIDFVQLCMYASYPWICLKHLQLGHVFFHSFCWIHAELFILFYCMRPKSFMTELPHENVLVRKRLFSQCLLAPR